QARDAQSRFDRGRPRMETQRCLDVPDRRLLLRAHGEAEYLRLVDEQSNAKRGQQRREDVDVLVVHARHSWERHRLILADPASTLVCKPLATCMVFFVRLVLMIRL